MNVSSFKFLLQDISLNITSDFMSNDVYESTVFACLYGLIFLFGIVSNMVVIIVYMTSENFKNYTRYFFINLSISDMISLIICIPKAISDLFITYGWKFGFYYCKFFFLLKYKISSYWFLYFNSKVKCIFSLRTLWHSHHRL